ncbi:MAG: copper amine oxidase N-terminal domain-containing protein [Syntrophothermaceae bacterium]
MRRARSKKLAIMILFTFMATLFAAVPMASAATTYSNALSTQTFEAGEYSSINKVFAKIKITIPKGAMTPNDTQEFFVRFDNDVYCGFDTQDPVPGGDNQVKSATVDKSVYAKSKAVDGQTVYNELKVTVTAKDASGINEEGTLYIPLKTIWVPSSASGDINAIIEAEPGSVFDDGKVIIARTSAGKVTVSIDKIETITDAGGTIGIVRIKEDMAKALDDTGKSVKIKLPKGFYWENTGSLSTKWGEGLVCTVVRDDFTDSANSKPRSIKLNVTQKSNTASYLELTGLIVRVDESEAKAGDVECTLSGDSDVAPETLIVAKYGEYTVDVEALSAPVRLAGKENQKLGKFSIKEQVPNSLIEKRTITLTLPSGVKWDYDVDNGNEAWPTKKSNESELNGLRLGLNDNSWEWTIVDSERRILKTTVLAGTDTSSDPAKLVLEEGKVAIEPGFSGDLTVTVGGSAGASGELVLAKVQSPVEGSVATMKNVKIGYQNQEVDDLILVESKSEAIAREEASKKDLPGGCDGIIKIKAPAGVKFSTTPTAEVLEGDLSIEKIWASSDRESISIKVNATSDKISEIKVSNILVTLDRTVPEGELKFDLMGGALVAKNIWDDMWYTDLSATDGTSTSKAAYFKDSDVSSRVVVANCVTPAPTDKKATAVFTIGETAYTLNGAEMTMDVAPYIKNDRTFLPVRFVSNAVGVADDNILWNDATKTVTILKGDRTVQMTINSKIMKVNGADIAIDVAPEIKSDRTMLPIRALSTALGCEILWDDATRTVTINY